MRNVPLNSKTNTSYGRSFTKRSGIMLCYPMDDRDLDKLLKKNNSAYVQPKLDGFRCRTAFFNNKVYLISSEENIITTCPHIEYVLNQLFVNHINPICDTLLKSAAIELDGELYTHRKSFEWISSKAKKFDKNDYASLEYHIFDLKIPNLSQGYRLEILKKLYQLGESAIEFFTLPIKLVETNLANSREEIISYSNKYLKNSYEGIIVRGSQGLYVEKRSQDMLKFKPKKFDYYKVLKLNEAVSSEGLPLGYLGSITCKSDLSDEKFNVGTGLGLDRSKLTEFWQNRGLYETMYARIGYQNLTSANGVPRFGKLLSFTKINPE